MTFLFYSYQLVRFDTFFFLITKQSRYFQCFYRIVQFSKNNQSIFILLLQCIFFKTVIVRYFFIGVLLCVFTKQSQYFCFLQDCFLVFFYKTVTVFLLIIGLLPGFFLQSNQSIFTILYGIVVILVCFLQTVTYYCQFLQDSYLVFLNQQMTLLTSKALRPRRVSAPFNSLT